MNRYTITRGSYQGTTDDRLDRWYIEDRDSDTVDRRGPGYATRREAQEELYRLNAEYEVECAAEMSMDPDDGWLVVQDREKERARRYREAGA